MPNINQSNTPTKIFKQNSEKRKEEKFFKQITNNNLPQRQSSSSFANTQKNATLPQTGTNRHFSLIMLAMRSLTLIGAFVAAWFSRKK